MLEVVKEQGATRSSSSIKNAVYNIIKKYFDDSELGGRIGTTSLVNSILDVSGVDSINTVRTDTGQYAEGLQLLIWNPIYPHQDIVSTGSDTVLPYFKFAYLSDPTNFLNKIEVTTIGNTAARTEY